MATEKKWYAVYTRPRWEKKVAELLIKKKIENYCPVNRVYRQWSDRKKIVLEPLFTSYVFVNVDDTQHLGVRLTDGVINFVYWLNKPAIIRNEEIDIIRKFLNEFKNVKVEKVPIAVKDSVRIVSGPFMEQEGEVVSVRNKAVKVLLPSLGYMMCAEIAASNLEILDSHKQQYLLSDPQSKYKSKEMYG